MGKWTCTSSRNHDDVIKWKHLPRYWLFLRGIHRTPVNCPHKGQWRGALMFSMIYAFINGWVNNRGAGDLRRHRAHYDVTVMIKRMLSPCCRKCTTSGSIKNQKIAINSNIYSVDIGLYNSKSKVSGQMKTNTQQGWYQPKRSCNRLISFDLITNIY